MDEGACYAASAFADAAHRGRAVQRGTRRWKYSRSFRKIVWMSHRTTPQGVQTAAQGPAEGHAWAWGGPLVRHRAMVKPECKFELVSS